jgi:hypothetical protein
MTRSTELQSVLKKDKRLVEDDAPLVNTTAELRKEHAEVGIL